MFKRKIKLLLNDHNLPNTPRLTLKIKQTFDKKIVKLCVHKKNLPKQFYRHQIIEFLLNLF